MAARAQYGVDPLAAPAQALSGLMDNLPRYAAMAAQISENRAQAALNQQKLAAPDSMGDLVAAAVSNPDSFRDNLPAITRAYMQGGGNAKDLGELFRSFGAQVPGMTDAQRMNLAIGAGQSLNENSAFSPSGQDAIAARNNRLAINRSIAEANAKPIDIPAGGTVFLPASNPLAASVGSVLRGAPTESTVKGAALAGAPPEMQRAAAMSGVTPRNYRTTDGKAGITLDGVTDAASGAPISQGANIYSTQAQPQDDLFSKNTRGNIVEQQAEIAATADIIKNMRELGRDPTNFGAAALVKGVVGDFASQASALAQLASTGLDANAAQQLNAEIQNIVGQTRIQKDPALAKLEVYRAILPYKLAAVLAGQSGRSASDKDVTGMKQTFEEAGLFGNAQDFETKLPVILNQLGFRQGLNEMLLGGKVPHTDFGDAQIAPTPAPAPAVKPDLIWDVQKGAWVSPGGG